MCIFSARVSAVGNTRIFARGSTDGNQFLVYSMTYAADSDLAMILPLPTPPTPPEDAVTFVDLSEYPDFFDDLAKGFPAPALSAQAPTAIPASLVVHVVGSFEASFVPSQRDFSRLDRRFVLPNEVWKQMPQYADYAFSVFKLRAGAHSVHPMAFEFPRRNANELFFPTVHIHHGKVEPKAYFDHSLYCQMIARLENWRVSSADSEGARKIPAKQFVKIASARGIVDPDRVVQMKRILGEQLNRDVILKE